VFTPHHKKGGIIMKTTHHNYIVSCCFYLVASSSAFVTSSPQQKGFLRPITSLKQRSPGFASYEEARNDFKAQGKIESLDFDQAKQWFRKSGYGAEFETYFEAREFFMKKGYLKKIENDYDGSGQFSFARDGETVDKSVFHDVIVALFLSDFVYCLGKLRKATKSLAFTDEGLKQEVVLGDSFDRNLEMNGKKLDPKGPMVKLMQGNLKVSKNPNIKTPEVDMAQFEDVLRYGGFQSVSKRFANELIITALHSFKVNKLFIHKFDAKYNNKNLVYSIAGRERKNGENTGEVETDLFLAFRGSSTTRDWFQNIQAPLVDVILRYDEKSGKCYMIEQLTFQKIEIEKTLHDKLNEVVEEAGTPIRVHQGFLGYLFADRGLDDKADDDKDNDSMYTNIRLNLVRLLDQKHTTTNSLYVTGHSLGGALSTLASFFLACDKEINNRSVDWTGVKCISFASPIVGNVSFQRAFEVLQAKEKYQSTIAKTTDGERLFKNIRITNNRDMVPLLPFFSRYRHTAGIHVHLNRPSLLSLWRPRKPLIEAQRAHWKSTLDLRRPWKIFHPTSLITGLFATSFRFLGLIATTIPALLIVPFVMIRPAFYMLPPFSQFKDVYLQIGSSKFFQNAFVAAIAAFVQQPMFKFGLLGLSWVSVLYLMTKKNTSVMERAGLVGLGFPGVVAMTRYFTDATNYKHFAKYWQVHFIVGVLVAQIAMLFVRKPAEVLAFQTHKLSDYYAHLRPNHPLLSSSTVLLDQDEN
jgi:hypothetical protein